MIIETKQLIISEELKRKVELICRFANVDYTLTKEYKKTRTIKFEFAFFMEGLVGFEPTIRELQSHALPLGYRPV